MDHPQQLSPWSVFELMLGPTRLAVLDAALDMGMADILTDTHDLSDIATALKVKAGTSNLIAFLDAMTALGLATKKNGRYRNTEFAERYMRTTSPTELVGLVKNLSRMQSRNLDRIPELVRQGPPAVQQQDRLEKEALWKKSVHHLASFHKAGMAEQVADTVSSLPEFPSMRRMLDIGCGPGIMCMAILKRHPSLTGVLCDLPAVIEVAKTEIAATDLASRITTIEGDYNEVDFGSGYDLIWASQTLYYARDLTALLARAHDALRPGGLFISVHEGLTHERTQPAGIILSRLSLALEGQDVSFEQGEINAKLLEVGFASTETRAHAMPMAPIDCIIARKRK
ncbi:methyltransferase [Pseudodesulfovibrio sp. JC047]|uniref:class I SAM-dependent methyltransferase n=1 Tax=Pseudodesulfovibrio sp. JC047 TaxID=2683199 RepID=UPI0013D4082C|nr:class I SAM-dependent methyltransferase [Pseudodesulfovibrio sp. JC047]NDV18467.1 methyltransferase [Pseudodesulfovibrio sp. JC047]